MTQKATASNPHFLTWGVAGEGAKAGAGEGAGEGWELSNTSLSSPPFHLAASSPSGMIGLPSGSLSLLASPVGIKMAGEEILHITFVLVCIMHSSTERGPYSLTGLQLSMAV